MKLKPASEHTVSLAKRPRCRVENMIDDVNFYIFNTRDFSGQFLDGLGLFILFPLQRGRFYDQCASVGTNPDAGKPLPQQRFDPTRKNQILHAVEGIGHGLEARIAHRLTDDLYGLGRIDLRKADDQVIVRGIRFVQLKGFHRPALVGLFLAIKKPLRFVW